MIGLLESLGFNLYLDWAVVIKLVCIIGSSILIGTNRGKQNQFAGLKTHLFVAVGAGLAFIVPEIYFANSGNLSADPFRVSAQVISGIGFLGAGAIIKSGLNVRGLTTAASLWVTAVVAIAFASGMLLIGAFATALVFVYLTFSDKLDPTYKYSTNSMIITLIDNDDNLDVINKYMQENTVLNGNPTILEIDHSSDKSVAIIAYEVNNYQTEMAIDLVIKRLATYDWVLKIESVSAMDKTNWRD